MFTQKITPAIHDTDALGHINNTVIPLWMERAREPIFKIFVPGLDPKKWNLVVVKLEVVYKKQIHYGKPVTIQTNIGKVGTSSFEVIQKVFQGKNLCARGITVQVHVNKTLTKSLPIPTNQRKNLKNHQK